MLHTEGVRGMEIKVKISGLEELVDDITKAKALINELGDVLYRIRMSGVSTAAEFAAAETEDAETWLTAENEI